MPTGKDRVKRELGAGFGDVLFPVGGADGERQDKAEAWSGFWWFSLVRRRVPTGKDRIKRELGAEFGGFLLSVGGCRRGKTG